MTSVGKTEDLRAQAVEFLRSLPAKRALAEQRHRAQEARAAEGKRLEAKRAELDPDDLEALVALDIECEALRAADQAAMFDDVIAENEVEEAPRRYRELVARAAKQQTA